MTEPLDLDAIRQRCERITALYVTRTVPELEVALEDIPSLLDEVQKLRAERLTFVERYGTHATNCVEHPYHGDPYSDAGCSCGWSEIVGRVIDAESDRLSASPSPTEGPKP